MPPWVSLFFTIFSHQPLKKETLHRIYTLVIQYEYTDQILISNSSDSFPKCPLNFSSYHFFDYNSI